MSLKVRITKMFAAEWLFCNICDTHLSRCFPPSAENTTLSRICLKNLKIMLSTTRSVHRPFLRELPRLRGYREDFSIELHARRMPECIHESRDVFMLLNQVGQFNVVSSIFQNVATFRSIHHFTRHLPTLWYRRFQSQYEMQNTNRLWIK